MVDALVSLEGGPRDKFWYWLAAWNTARESAQAWHLREDQPLPDVLRYEATGRMRDNPDPRFGQGEIWRYRPATVDVDAGPVTVTLASGTVAVVCPKCARPAPALITFRLAHRDEVTQECPRCAYPTERYQGDRLETMPDVFQDWYEAHEFEPLGVRCPDCGEWVATHDHG